ncbi:MAG: SGNH/GDSL hydrolase family protein [Clostridia bacterium]|nr:SGNH/GDSL hydrolase family protein [Clostridia bacterium]
MEQLQILENGEQPKKKLINLNLKQVKAITHGALYIYDDMGGFTFSRFTPAQTEHYSKFPLFKDIAKYNAGVHFDFYTDSPVFEMDFTCIDNHESNSCSLDILENGALCYSMPADFKQGKKYSVRYEFLKPGKNRITVYLPAYSELIVKRISLIENCDITPVKHAKKMLFVGDSITQGMYVNNTSATYASMLTRMFDLEALNQGVSGYYYNVDSLDGGLSFGPDYILISYGTNDKRYNKTIPELMASVEAYIKKLTSMYKKAKFFLVVPWWRLMRYDESVYLKNFEEVRQAIFDVVEKYPQLVLIDGYSATPHLEEFFADRTHPGQAAHAHMALHIAGVIRKYIK